MLCNIYTHKYVYKMCMYIYTALSLYVCDFSNPKTGRFFGAPGDFGVQY